jgi:hypothetical protein
MNDRIAVADAFKHLGVGRPLGEGISTSGFSWLSLKSKTWTLHHQGETRMFVREDDGTPLPYLDAVIVGVNPGISKLFYVGSYTEGSAAPPDCASADGVKPDPGVPQQQNPICGTCRHNAWGSAVNGKGKACQDHKKIAVLLMPYLTKKLFDGQPMLTPVYLKVPPDSLKNWKSYGDTLQHRGAHWASVITRIGFAPDRLFQLTFAFHKALTNAEAPVVIPLLEDPQTLNLIGTGPGGGAALPHIPEVPEPEDTGLLEAFGKASPAPAAMTTVSRRGRPPGSPNKPKAPEPRVAAARAPEPESESEQAGNGGTSPWDAPPEDADLDDRVKNALKGKISGMMPK